MPIDIRATVTCSLGTLISGSINDDYVQGTGLIKTRGSVEISGIVTPAIGTAVTFSYTKGGTTRSIPRKLRVLSSFADPFRRTTRVELGCKLTYLSDLKEPVDWTAFDDSANDGYDEDDARIITLPISAASVMAKCLEELDITASSSPLTNKFSVASFDLSGGYVNVLSSLLVSECYCGYLDASEVLQVFSLDQPGGAGPVLDKASIIDLGSIGVGQLPGEAVTVSYSTLKLQPPDVVQNNTSGSGGSGGTSGTRPGWDRSETTTTFEVQVPYTAVINRQPVNRIRTYNVEDRTVTTTSYGVINVNGEQRRVVFDRYTEQAIGAPAIAGSLITAYLSNGIGFNYATAYKYTFERYGYDGAGNEVFVDRQVRGSAWHVIGSLSLPFVFSSTDFVSVFWDGVVDIEREVIRKQVVGNSQSVFITRYGNWLQTINGQQTIAESRNSFLNASDVAEFINNSLGPLMLIESRSTIERRTESQSPPSEQDIINSSNSDGGDPNNGWRTESSSEVELALGSATAQRRIELSMPYAPDDVFSGPSGGPFTSVASDAAQKAKRYGLVQNRLLLGNRSGMNIQTAPELLPAAPFAAFLVEANGVSGLYRTNGTSWTMSSEGVLISTDALFWGAVGGTGDFFFPVAPGITELPFTPPAVDGVVTVPTVVPVWNETLLLDARTRTLCTITGLPYALEITTELDLVTHTAAAVVSLITVPIAAVALASLAPEVSSGASVAVPVAVVSVAAVAPAMASGGAVAVPAAAVDVAGVVPDLVGRQRIQVVAPTGGVTVAGLAPAVAAGASVPVPAVGVTVAGAAPESVGFPDPYFSQVALLLHMDGTDGSSTFTDSSSYQHTVTANGATISTTQSRFGGAGGRFIAASSHNLEIDANAAFEVGSADYTIEFWSYLQSNENVCLFRTADNRIGLLIDDSRWVFKSTTSTDANVFVLDRALAPALNQMLHIAIERFGSTTTLYIQGTAVGSGTSRDVLNTNAQLVIGTGFGYALNGWLDELRFTNGYARYQGGFTPPVEPFLGLP